ncbi:MAG: hypothetical protein IIA83_00320 [Thaumarchaeota archaeon]|nr:hypothetical protein [Nitrososphaerota archaeon]
MSNLGITTWTFDEPLLKIIITVSAKTTIVGIDSCLVAFFKFITGVFAVTHEIVQILSIHKFYEQKIVLRISERNNYSTNAIILA